MRKRFLSLALAFCLCLSPWLFPAARANGPVQISSAEDLIAFAKRVNNGEYGLDAVMTADIPLGVHDWKTPIAAFDQHSDFRLPGYTGTFDGAGHRLYSILADCSIFGKIDAGGVVKNLTVDATAMHCRAVLAYCNAGTISNCHTSGALYPAEDGSLPLIGGIAAELGCLTPSSGYVPGVIENCTSSVDIHFYPSVVNYGYYNIGGIVGVTHEGVVDRCFFRGSIELQGAVPDCSANVGGIVGAVFAPVVNCGNTGSIRADVHSTYQSPVEIGGVVGSGTYDMVDGKARYNVVNCWNTGDIQVTTASIPAACNGISGGRRGYAGGLDEVRNCWSSGTVTVSSDSGDSGQGSSDTCYFLEGTNYNSGGSPTFTADELYGGMLVDKLNEYVRQHPSEGLLSWTQGPWGPELSDSYTPPEDSAAIPSTPAPSVPVSQTPNASGFMDVPENQYYYEPVIWAVQQGITEGTSAATFSPEKTCTKGEIMTFLWRAMGRPEPEQDSNPFFYTPQIQEGDYYYKPFVWALEIGALFEDEHFTFERGVNPKSPCTRAAAVYYIWAALDHPFIESWNQYILDVNPMDHHYMAVLWAMNTGVTTGTAEGLFSPNQTCTRGQIVTFLYRAFHQ